MNFFALAVLAALNVTAPLASPEAVSTWAQHARRGSEPRTRAASHPQSALGGGSAQKTRTRAGLPPQSLVRRRGRGAWEKGAGYLGGARGGVPKGTPNKFKKVELSFYV